MARSPPPPSDLLTDASNATHTGREVSMKPYAIGTAARLAGIPPETLRIWERRYTMLEPDRTVGGHRLYSDDDVEVLRAVKRLVDAGMRVSAVARMGRPQILEEAARQQPTATAAPSRGAEALIEEIIVAARGFDHARVSALLDRPLLFSSGEQATRSLYLPLMREVGDRWHRGELAVGVEHFIEKLVTGRIHAILQATPQPDHGRLALLACPADELHEVGLFAAALNLRTHGFSTAVLGANLPAADLAAAAARLAPSLLVLGVTNALSRAALAELPPALQRPPLLDVPLLIGGSRAAQLGESLTRPWTLARSVEDVGALAHQFAR